MPQLPDDCQWCYKIKNSDGLILTTPYAKNTPNMGSGYPLPLDFKRKPDSPKAATKQTIRQTLTRADF